MICASLGMTSSEGNSTGGLQLCRIVELCLGGDCTAPEPDHAALRDAELLYRSGLGLMALGPECIVTESGQHIKQHSAKLHTEEACPLLSLEEDNRRAATLLLNLAQTLLKLPSPSGQATKAALEAITVLLHCILLSSC